MSLEQIQFSWEAVILVVPGFMTVFAYYRKRGGRGLSTLEYSMLSVFWGIATLIIYGIFLRPFNEDAIKDLLSNIFGASLVFYHALGVDWDTSGAY